jgi:hypothetical protein
MSRERTLDPANMVERSSRLLKRRKKRQRREKRERGERGHRGGG